MISFLGRLIAGSDGGSWVDSVRRRCVALGLSCTAATIVFALVRPRLGPRDGWVELVDDLEPWAYAPAPLMVAVGAALRSRTLMGAGAALALTFGARWGRRYLRRSVESDSAAADLRFMTFNTLAWERPCDDLADVIRASGAHVVGLQEIGPTGAEYLAETLRDIYPHAFITPSADSSGAAVLSRFPLRDPVGFRASDLGHWWQRMVIESPRGPITFVNVHTKIPHIHTIGRFGFLKLPRHFHAERRRREVRLLCESIDHTEGPLVVSGDFNMTERSQDYAMLARRLCDAFGAVGVGLGHTFPARGALPRAFPAPWPMLRLDYIWHSDHFGTVWARRGDCGQSDHHPVMAGLRWSEAAAPSRIDTGIVPLAASAM